MSQILTWEQAVSKAAERSLDLNQKDLASLVTYARQAGIGTSISFQKTQYVDGDLDKLKKVVLWWEYLNSHSAEEWRDKNTCIAIQKIVASAISKNNELEIYAVFCPSYKTGAGASGYTGVTGNHTKALIKSMSDFTRKTRELGIKVKATAYLSDLLLENHSKLDGTSYKKDLESNYLDFCREIELNGAEIEPRLLSEIKDLKEKIGEKGIVEGPCDIPADLYERVYKRNLVFYENNLGWTQDDVKFRTDVLARCYSYMGDVFRIIHPQGIMYWTESAYERGVMYSGSKLDKPIPIIYPKK